jgi:hypothetical protein
VRAAVLSGGVRLVRLLVLRPASATTVRIATWPEEDVRQLATLLARLNKLGEESGKR